MICYVFDSSLKAPAALVIFVVEFLFFSSAIFQEAYSDIAETSGFLFYCLKIK